MILYCELTELQKVQSNSGHYGKPWVDSRMFGSEITAKDFAKECYLKDMKCQSKTYLYDSEKERNSHVMRMLKDGWVETGKKRENVGSIGYPVYIWCATFTKKSLVK